MSIYQDMRTGKIKEPYSSSFPEATEGMKNFAKETRSYKFRAKTGAIVDGKILVPITNSAAAWGMPVNEMKKYMESFPNGATIATQILMARQTGRTFNYNV